MPNNTLVTVERQHDDFDIGSRTAGRDVPLHRTAFNQSGESPGEPACANVSCRLVTPAP
jgi:hypothetical protein